MNIDVLSLFPGYFKGPLQSSILKKAIQQGILKINLTDIRDFARGRHKRVDDKQFGGGPGMVMMPEPVTDAIYHVKTSASKVIHLSPQGTLLDAAKCRALAKESHLVLVCTHYRGLDQRVIDRDIDEEISIGDYVLTNGCLAALVLIDACVRFIKGVLGDEKSCEEDSFEQKIFDYPLYTYPREFKGNMVPDVLLKGNHREINLWRKQAAIKKTMERRPDLLDVF